MQINKLDTVLCEALEHAGIDLTPIQWARAGEEWFSIGEALASGAKPCGPLLLECQGQRDYSLAVNCAHGLRRRMAADGREISDTSIDDAIGDACLALAQWRASGPAVTMREDTRGKGHKSKPVNQAACVAWRAVVESLKHDILGDSVPLFKRDEWNGETGPESADWLYQSALPMPGGEDTRERWTRRQIERARDSRLEKLNSKCEELAISKGKGAGKARRVQAVEKIQRAIILLIHGEALDKAAELAGFTASGRSRAGDRLAQACKRVGLPLGRFTERDSS